jgi:microcystin-dependent protein
MTIETTTSSVTYQGNDATTVFTYGFLISAAADAVVSLTDIAGNTTTTLDPAAYTITGLADANGGTVTYPLVGSPITTASNLTIQRVLPLTQEVDLTNQDGFFPSVLEDALDNLCMEIQQVQEQIDRAVIFPVGTTVNVPALTAAILAGADQAAAAAASATAAAASAAQALAALPIGVEMDWPGTSAPSLWLLEYGQIVAQTSYPELFAILGTTYNTGGEGAGNFRLPDGRGAVYAGKADMGGTDKANLPGGTTLGAIIGGEAGTGVASTVTIARTHLPNISFTNVGIAVSDTRAYQTAEAVPHQGSVLALPGAGGVLAASIAKVAIELSNSGVLSVSNQGSAASGGSGTGLSVVQPTGIRNKIIYAGR